MADNQAEHVKRVAADFLKRSGQEPEEPRSVRYWGNGVWLVSYDPGLAGPILGFRELFVPIGGEPYWNPSD